MLNDKIHWIAWTIVTGFLLWVLVAAVKAGVMLLSGSLAGLFALLIVPALALDIWLLDGCIIIARRSWRR